MRDFGVEASKMMLLSARWDWLGESPWGRKTQQLGHMRQKHHNMIFGYNLLQLSFCHVFISLKHTRDS